MIDACVDIVVDNMLAVLRACNILTWEEAICWSDGCVLAVTVLAASVSLISSVSTGRPIWQHLSVLSTWQSTVEAQRHVELASYTPSIDKSAPQKSQTSLPPPGLLLSTDQWRGSIGTVEFFLRYIVMQICMLGCTLCSENTPIYIVFCMCWFTETLH